MGAAEFAFKRPVFRGVVEDVQPQTNKRRREAEAETGTIARLINKYLFLT